MAAKKQDKSSKTAHVLNLLTKPSQAAQPAPLQEAPEAAAQVQPAAAPAQAAPLVPPIIQNAQSEANLSDQIRGALEDDLTAALSAAPIADDFSEVDFSVYDDLTEGYEQPEPAQAAQEEAPAPQPAPAAAPAPQPEQPAPQPAPEPIVIQAAPIKTAPEPPKLLYLNIMQPLVEAAAPRYIKLSGLCDCPRCQADVRAHALTHLKPHYAVFRQDDSIPMLTLYEARYASQVATALMQACEVVKENPRHRYRY